jgi:hypothetical protein
MIQTEILLLLAELIEFLDSPTDAAIDSEKVANDIGN